MQENFIEWALLNFQEDAHLNVLFVLMSSFIVCLMRQGAILEKNQRKDGILMPSILSKYLEFDKISVPK